MSAKQDDEKDKVTYNIQHYYMYNMHALLMLIYSDQQTHDEKKVLY